MRVFVRKMSSMGLLKFRLIISSVLMTAAMIVPPVGIAFIDITILSNPYVWLVFAGVILFFGAIEYFFCIRPFLIYRSLPDVLAETDGEFLYIHTKKEAKIPLSEIELATVYVDLPYSLVQEEVLTEFIIHLGTENYGTVILELPGHGNYKMRFAAEAEDAGDELIGFFKDMFKEENTQKETER
jgi:hypothetical protein